MLGCDSLSTSFYHRLVYRSMFHPLTKHVISDSKEEKPKKKVTKPAKKSKPKPARKGSDDEIASAESDDGDEEGEEVDYMSDSGSSSR